MSHSFDDMDGSAPQLDAALQATLNQPVPADALERVKLRAKQLARPETVVTPLPKTAGGLRFSGSLMATLAVMAPAIAIMLALFSTFEQRGQAFADVLKNVKSAQAVQFKMSMVFNKRQEQVSTMYLTAQQMRVESFGGVLIMVADFERQQALYLDQPQKKGQHEAINPEVSKRFANPITELRKLNLVDARKLGAEDLAGRRTHVYSLNKFDFMGFGQVLSTKVWVDAESKLPVRIICEDTDPKAPFSVRFDEFVWNPELDAKLFSTDIPAGFEGGTVVLRREKSDAPAAKPVYPNTEFAAGVISNDRVPGVLMLSPDGTKATAIVRESEANNKPSNFQPHELRQWDLATGKLLWSETVAGSNSLAASSDGQHLVTVIGYEIQFRDASTGKIIRTWTTERSLSALAFSRDGKLLAGGISEWGPGGKQLPGGIEIWNVEQGTLLRTIKDDLPISCVKFSPDGTRLVSSSNDGPVKLWNLSNREMTTILPGYLRADFSPDGKQVACPSTERSGNKKVTAVNVYDATNGQLIRKLSSDPGREASFPLWVEFSADGTKVVAADWNGTVVMWDAKSGELIPTSVTHKAGVHVATFGPTGNTLVTGSEDKSLRVWKLSVDKE